MAVFPRHLFGGSSTQHHSLDSKSYRGSVVASLIVGLHNDDLLELDSPEEGVHPFLEQRYPVPIESLIQMIHLPNFCQQRLIGQGISIRRSVRTDLMSVVSDVAVWGSGAHHKDLLVNAELCHSKFDGIEESFFEAEEEYLISKVRLGFL